MIDEITQKHLDKARVRGAPATIPGSAGMISSYDCEEITRHAVRALSLPLPNDFSPATLRQAYAKLAQTAAVQQLRVLEAPLLALHADPMEDVPYEWDWRALLPVRGRAKPDEAEGVSVARVHGGQYIEAATNRGVGDLPNVYTYFLGQFLPSRKQQLTRPILYHRVLDGIEGESPGKLTIKVFIPIQLSLKQPTRLVTREELG